MVNVYLYSVISEKYNFCVSHCTEFGNFVYLSKPYDRVNHLLPKAPQPLTVRL